MNRTLWPFLAALLALGCGPGAPKGAAVVKVTRGDLVFSSSFFGELEAAESHPVFTPEFRNVWQITVESVLPDGTQVKKGDPVLTFARGTFEEDLRDKEAELAVAEAGLRKVLEQLEDEKINRQLSVKRAELAVDLAKMNVVEGVNLISKIELEKARVDLARAELSLELAKKELASFDKKRAAALEVEKVRVTTATEKVKDVKAQLEKMVVRAPADGVLYAPYTRLNWQMSKVAPGKVVRPGDKLLELPELDRFKANIYVRQRDASHLKVGDPAQVMATMFPDVVIQGKVVSRDDFATTRNERTGGSGPQGTLKELRVVLELEQAPVQLRPGGTVRADLSTVLAKGVLQVPLAALREKDGAWSATRPGGQKVAVKVGQSSPTHAEVLDGLAEGDAVLLE